MIKVFQRRDKLIARFLKSACFVLCFIFPCYDACCDEVYSIDDSPLYLYKTINWWYDCLPEQSRKLCGRPVKCSNAGNARVKYDERHKKIEISIKGGFAAMLSAIKECKQCYGPSYFRCTRLQNGFSKNTAVTVLLNDSSIISGFSFNQINREQARHIQSMEHDLQFILEGVIGGLSNGRIALHASGNLLKKCSEGSGDPEEKYPIRLKIINKRTNGIIAILDMVWGI